jgi:hypothetical protein
LLYKVNTLAGYKLHCLDGDIGGIKEFYFDDHLWTIRYLVADTGNWLANRQVLISPYALVALHREEKNISINLTMKQIENSPAIATDQPVSRQYEESYYSYFGWTMYWGGPNTWGLYPDIVRERDNFHGSNKGEKPWDAHLRSTSNVTGYRIHAVDGEIGHIDDFIVDDVTWEVRYLVVNTQNWWPGKKVLISPKWIARVSWSESTVFVNHNRESIKSAPEYSETSLLARGYEAALHKHYDLQGYWVAEPVARE